jgi:hypothetical protein
MTALPPKAATPGAPLLRKEVTSLYQETYTFPHMTEEMKWIENKSSRNTMKKLGPNGHIGN